MPELFSVEEVYPRSTVTGLNQRLDHRFTVPETMTRRQFDKLSPSAQRAYDDLRLEHLGAGLWLPTPEFRMMMRYTRAAMRTSSRMTPGERGIVITGPAHIGKSTCAMRLHEAVAGLVAERIPDFRERGIVPSVHVDVQPRSTPKNIACHILDFFEADYSPRWTQAELIGQATGLLRAHRTSVVVFDEFQMLNLEGKTGDDAINTIRTIMNASGALFVFSGIDLVKRLSSRAADQIMERCQFIQMLPLSRSTDWERDEWQKYIATFGAEMRLLDGDGDHLSPFTDLLHRATGGSIGNLRRILSVAMETALHDRKDGVIEEITEGLLEEVIRFDARHGRVAG